MTVKKTTLPSPRNDDRDKVKVETEKMNTLLANIRTGNIIELYELIYAGAKLVRDKIGVPLRNSDRNIKSGWETESDGLRNYNKVLKKEKHKEIFWDENTKRKHQVSLIVQHEEVNQKILAKEQTLKR